MARRHAALAAALLVLTAGGSAVAQIPNPAAHFGAFGGYHLFSSDSDLRDNVVPRARHINSGADFGVRIGYDFNWLLGVEVQLEDVATSASRSGGSVQALNFRGLLVFHMLENSPVLIPYGVVGAGLYTMFSDDLGDDQDYLITYGLGCKFMLADWVAFRVQIDHVIQGDAIKASVAHNFDFTGGFDFFVSFAEPPLPPPPPDKDNDGLLDTDDRCPLEPGPAEMSGCPDTDKDGIPDIDDQCVTDKGQPELLGCPDSDGDRVIDRKDRCPKQPGPSVHAGCPDTDGDQIPDDFDECPLMPGVAEQGGCPAQPTAEVISKFTGAIRGINFETGRASIRPSSYALLNEAVGVLKEFPDLKLVIEGHTDSRGPDARNLKLSQDRADAVKEYITAQGVDVARLTAIGYGETKPMAENDTETGRAENRRIEFHITQPNVPRVPPAAEPAPPAAEPAPPAAEPAPPAAEPAPPAAEPAPPAAEPAPPAAEPAVRP